eukprot:scaffold23661_cov75-Phaeocystis_antarctica.AAC.2
MRESLARPTLASKARGPALALLEYVQQQVLKSGRTHPCVVISMSISTARDKHEAMAYGETHTVYGDRWGPGTGFKGSARPARGYSRVPIP